MECRLSLVTAAREGRSYMKDLYVTPPFRVVSVGQLARDGGAYLMVMSSSPGILDGDHYHVDIRVCESARLQLQSQSYQRLFHMEQGATQQMNICLERGASFSQVPHPIVPHEGSVFHSVCQVDMGEDCSFLQSEIITCGRKHYGEAFRFRDFRNLLEVRYAGRLLLKDNIRLKPADMPLSSIGLLEGHTHQGTLVYLNTQHQPMRETIEEVHSLVETFEGVEFGLSLIAGNGFVLRALGNGGERLLDCFRAVQQYMWQQ